MIEHRDVARPFRIFAAHQLAIVTKVAHGEILAVRQQLQCMEQLVARLDDKLLVRLDRNSDNKRKRIVSIVANAGALDSASPSSRNPPSNGGLLLREQTFPCVAFSSIEHVRQGMRLRRQIYAYAIKHFVQHCVSQFHPCRRTFPRRIAAALAAKVDFKSHTVGQ